MLDQPESRLPEIPDSSESRDLRASRPSLLRYVTSTTMLLRGLDAMLLAVMDVVLLFASLMIALRIKTLLLGEDIALSSTFEYAKNVLPIAALVMLLLFAGDGLYKQRNLRPGAARILGSLFKVTLVTLAFALIEGERFSSYYVFWGTLLVASVLIVGARLLFDFVATKIEGAFGKGRKAVIIGVGDQIDAVGGALMRASIKRIMPVGYIAHGVRPKAKLRDFGDLATIEDHFDEIEEVIIADPDLPPAELVTLVDRCHRGGVHVRIAPTTMEILRADVAEFIPGESLPLFEVKPPVLEGAQFVVKRLFDLVVAGVLILLLSPLLIALALMVKLTSRGSVFFVSPRPGLAGDDFGCIKYRTMVSDADSLQDELEHMNEAGDVIFKIKKDPRLTKVGGLLRRWSLDELPQLFNVIKGDMSLVGPRPLPWRDYELLEEWHKKRYLVLPGITGLWQVSGRSDLDFDDLVRLDFHYIEHWSVFSDIVILLRTIPAVFLRRGAY